AGPVAAGAVFAGWEGGAVELRAGQCVVLGGVWRAVDAGRKLVALLVERVLPGEVGIVVLQAVEIGRHDDAFLICPRTIADAVNCIDRARTLGAEVGAPGAMTH